MTDIIVSDQYLTEERKAYEMPPEGVYNGVCVDVIHLGDKWSHRKGVFQPSAVLVFQLNAKGANGEFLIVDSPIFSLSIHPRSGLREFLEAWGVLESDERTINLSELIGGNARIWVTHKVSNSGAPYAKIQHISLRESRGRYLKPKNYIRSPYWGKMKARFAEEARLNQPNITVHE